jgi:hypothetical protein
MHKGLLQSTAPTPPTLANTNVGNNGSPRHAVAYEYFPTSRKPTRASANELHTRVLAGGENEDDGLFTYL